MKVINKKSIKKSFSWMMIFSLMVQVFIGATPVFADQLAAGKMPSSGTNVVSSGVSSWSNTNNIGSDNGSLINNNGFATATIAQRDVTGCNRRILGVCISPIYGSNKTTNYLVGSDYGFNLPSNAVIEGIKVSIDRKASLIDIIGLGVSDKSVNLVKSGSVEGNNYANTSLIWSPISSVVNYGGSTDLWGTTWTAADINSPDFGVAISAQSNAYLSSRTASVDYMSIDVYYSSAPVIDYHEDVTAFAANSDGTVVEYIAPNSTDDVDGILPATCLPVSGSIFNVGSTKVTCDKTDAAGNVAVQTSFNVIVEDNIHPTAYLNFYLGTGPLANSFKVVFSEQVEPEEAANSANYYLTNWPGTGGSGPLNDNAIVNYDVDSHTSTVIFTNPGWYISPEQTWGVTNIHDLAGNVLDSDPTDDTSTDMLPPITTANFTGEVGLNGFYTSDITVTFESIDGDETIDPYSGLGSETKTTYYSVDDGEYVAGTSVVVSSDGDHTVCYYSVDNAGNMEQPKCDISFTIDQTHPVITIDPYDLLPTNKDINVSAKTDSGVLNVDSNLFTTNGSFDFVAVDEAGNSTTKTVTISNIDKTSPVIKLNGDASTGVTVGGLYTELGAIADDGSSVSISGIVNTAVVGTYTITYTSTDAAGNVAVPVIRTVTVSAAPVFFTAGGEVLGDTTTETPVDKKEEVKGDSDKKDDFNWWQDAQFQGIAWYWWLIGGFGAAGIGWWFIAGFRRRREDN